MKKYKYKREHFGTQEQFDRYRKRQAKAQKAWLNKVEEANPEHKERRLLRQRLYRHYHYYTDCRQSFVDWLKDVCHIDSLKDIQIDLLRDLVKQKLNNLKIKVLAEK